MGEFTSLLEGLLNMPKPQKKKLTPQQWINRVGIVLLGMFLIVIGLIQLEQWGEQQAKIKETNKILHVLVESFAHNDHEIINSWAAGKIQDAWQGPMILSSIDNKISFTSKGPDGELDTNDDLKSEVFPVKPRNRYNPPPDGPDFLTAAKRKAGELVDQVKETVDNGEAEVKGRGWSFQWKWGKSKE